MRDPSRRRVWFARSTGLRSLLRITLVRAVRPTIYSCDLSNRPDPGRGSRQPGGRVQKSLLARGGREHSVRPGGRRQAYALGVLLHVRLLEYFWHLGILARCAVRFFIFHPAVSSAQVLDVGALGWSDPSRQPHAQGRGAKKRTQRAGRLDRATRSNFKPYGGARSQGHDTGLRGLAGCTPSAPTSPLRASSYRPVALPVPRNLCVARACSDHLLCAVCTQAESVQVRRSSHEV